MELTFLSQRVAFCGHLDKIWVWIFTTLTFLEVTELAVRENKTTARLRRLSSGVISILLTPVSAGAAPPPPESQPSPSLRRQTSDCRFAGDPPSAFCSTFTRIPAGWVRDTEGYRCPAGHSGPVGHLGERRGSLRAARWRRPLRSEWRFQEGRGQSRKSTRPALPLWNRCPDRSLETVTPPTSSRRRQCLRHHAS